jgi:hypothetical protein
VPVIARICAAVIPPLARIPARRARATARFAGAAAASISISFSLTSLGSTTCFGGCRGGALRGTCIFGLSVGSGGGSGSRG